MPVENVGKNPNQARQDSRLDFNLVGVPYAAFIDRIDFNQMVPHAGKPAMLL